jgi:hypothetical protein
LAATAEEREMIRRQKERSRKKRHYERHIGEPKKLRHRPVYFPPEDDRRLDDMMRRYAAEGESMTAFMLRIFREWADRMDEAERRAAEALENPTLTEPAPLENPTPPVPEPTPAPTKAAERRKAAKRPAEPAPKKPRSTYSRRWVDRAEADAANRVPVRLEFTRPNHHIPHGMRSMMMNSGLQHRNNIWRGRLTPEHAAAMAEQIAGFGGSLEITGGLGDGPKWAPGEYRQMAKAD